MEHISLNDMNSGIWTVQKLRAIKGPVEIEVIERNTKTGEVEVVNKVMDFDTVIRRCEWAVDKYIKNGKREVIGQFFTEIVWSLRFKTAATDGIRLFFNPVFANELITKGAMKAKEEAEKEGKNFNSVALDFPSFKLFLFVVTHEVYHQLYRHIEQEQHKNETAGGKYHDLANESQDIEINRDIEIQWPEFAGSTVESDGCWETDKYPQQVWGQIFDDKFAKGEFPDPNDPILPPPVQQMPPMGGGDDIPQQNPDNNVYTAPEDYKDGWEKAIADIKAGKIDPKTWKPLPVDPRKFDHKQLGQFMTSAFVNEAAGSGNGMNQDEWNQGYNDCIRQWMNSMNGGGGGQAGPQFGNLEQPPSNGNNGNQNQQNQNGQQQQQNGGQQGQQSGQSGQQSGQQQGGQGQSGQQSGQQQGSQQNGQGGSGSSDSDIDNMSASEAAADAAKSAKTAIDAAKEAISKAQQSGNPADQSAANQAKRAANQSIQAAKDAKDAAANGNTEQAQQKAKEARDAAGAAQSANNRCGNQQNNSSQSAGHGSADNSDINGMSASEAAADAAQSAKDAVDAAKEAINKAQQSGSSADQAAANQAKSAANQAIQAAKDAKNAAAEGNKSKAQKKAKEARDAANAAKNAANQSGQGQGSGQGDGQDSNQQGNDQNQSGNNGDQGDGSNSSGSGGQGSSGMSGNSDANKSDAKVPIEINKNWGANDVISKEQAMQIAEEEGQPYQGDELTKKPEDIAKGRIQRSEESVRNIGKGTSAPMDRIMDDINKLLRPPVSNWKALLAKHLRSAGDKREFFKMDKRRIPIDRPDWAEEELPTKKTINNAADVFYLVDISGSISNRDLYRAFSEIIGGIETRKDMKIRKSAFTYFADRVVDSLVRTWTIDDSKAKKLKLIQKTDADSQCGGGTDIAGSVAHVVKLKKYYSTKDPKTLLIVFTDGEDWGFDEIEKMPPNQKKEIIFCLLNSKSRIPERAQALAQAGIPIKNIVGIDTESL